MYDADTDRRVSFDEFHNRTVVVTGGAAGIGGATSCRFAAAGAKVVIVDMNALACNDAVEWIRERGGAASAITADVSDSQACRDAIKRIVDLHGVIDVLVNCAGITRRADVVDTTVDEWDRVIAVNLKSVFLMCKYAIPVMRKQSGGKIINVASGWGLVGGAKAVAYCASKGGVVLLTKALAVDHGPEGIAVNCVCPGDTETGLLTDEARQLGLSDNALIEEGRKRPLGRVGKPEEIAASILYLASSAASFVTGAVLVVDGGGLAGSM